MAKNFFRGLSKRNYTENWSVIKGEINQRNMTIKNFALYSTALVFFIACNTTNDELVDGERRSFSISNDRSQLNSRVTNLNEPITIIPIGNARINSNISLTLISEINSPTNDGVPVMATSISENEDHIVVSYNTAGEDYGGAAVVLQRANSELEILSEVVFSDADISHAILSNDQLYVGGAKDVDENPAWVGTFGYVNNTIDKNTFNEIQVGGFVATSLISSENSIFVTAGAGEATGSGLFQLDRTSLAIQNQSLLSDPRWSRSVGDNIFIQNGMPGKIEVYENGNSTNSFSIADADLESKATFDLVDEYIFAATGRNGAEIYQLDGQYQGAIALPDVNSADFTTNAIAVYGDMIFISNGTTIYVATFENDEDLIPDVVGELELGDFESVNHILFQDNYLIVASGLGGVKVIELQEEVSPPLEGEILSRENMSIIYFDSEEPKRDRYASYVLDGNVNTFWHTEWVDADPIYPHELWVDLGNEYELSEFRYLSRQWGNFNGTVRDFELYITNDIDNWGAPFHTGTLNKTREEQTVLFSATAQGRYFRFLCLSEVNGNPWTSCAEINFVGTLTQ